MELKDLRLENDIFKCKGNLVLGDDIHLQYPLELTGSLTAGDNFICPPVRSTGDVTIGSCCDVLIIWAEGYANIGPFASIDDITSNHKDVHIGMHSDVNVIRINDPNHSIILGADVCTGRIEGTRNISRADQ